jgi:hypothetical protein
LSQINGSFAFVEARGFSAAFHIPVAYQQKNVVCSWQRVLSWEARNDVACFDLQLPTLAELAEQRPLSGTIVPFKDLQIG